MNWWKILPSRKSSLLAASVAVLLLISCAQPETVKFSDIAAANAPLKVTYPARPKINVDAYCDEGGDCTLPAGNLEILMQIITDLRDEVESRIDAYNKLVDSLSHCEYAGAKRKEALGYAEQRYERSELISGIKTIVTAIGCGVLLGTM